MIKYLLLFLSLTFFFSCSRKEEITFEKIVEASVQVISEKTGLYLSELSKPTSTFDLKANYVNDVGTHIIYNINLIKNLKEVDETLPLKKYTLIYFGLLNEFIIQSKSLMNYDVNNKANIIHITNTYKSLNNTIQNQFAIFCKKHKFEMGLSIYDIEKYEEELKKATKN